VIGSTKFEANVLTYTRMGITGYVTGRIRRRAGGRAGGTADGELACSPRTAGMLVRGIAELDADKSG
jgi:hypothetical protein